MYWSLSLIVTTLCFIERSAAYNYDPSWTEYNLNTNQQAKNPLEYSGQWDGHQYTASPKNWRIPFYSLFLDDWKGGSEGQESKEMKVVENKVRQLLLITRAHL